MSMIRGINLAELIKKAPKAIIRFSASSFVTEGKKNLTKASHYDLP
jgi:hypothetical protein